MATLGLDDTARTVLLRMEQVPAVDATGLVALESALQQLQQRGCLTVITGLQAQPRRALANALITERPGILHIRDGVGEAMEELRRAGPDLSSTGATAGVEAGGSV